MTDDLSLIGLIAKLELKPDDIVVLKTTRPISKDTAERIEDYFKSRLPSQNKIVVLDGLDMQVLSPTETLGSREVAAE